MYKVAGLAATPGALGLLSVTVFAATEDKNDPTLRTDELSLYTTPQQKFRYVEPEAGQLEQGVSQLRKAAEPYTTWCQQTGLAVAEKVQGVYGELKPKVESTIQFGKESYDYLRDPPSGFYPRVGVIGFAGILGLFFARGSRIKKLIYPTGLMALAASMYYPQQAASIAKVTGDTLYEWSLQGYVTMESLWKGKPTTKQLKEKSEKAEEKPQDSSDANRG
ncbi:apolipoprotein O, a isoform X1 [Megalops cyprinoides]|uniref:apolipoprotein O, a isoform X1 n=1 Tax=Megalops cyprinoides TaxID=118141 RepID=UPI0018645981|nr:apolipoprotein O, a isoform X1 [Megalops cyprinoides]XP_036380182.1 apolipoprotein O, a isoform X1 [Megalops cyprinoides]